MVSTVSKLPTATKATQHATHNGGEKFNMGSYFKGVQYEFKQISWPPKQQVILETIVVIIVVALFATFIAISDWLLAVIIQFIT